MRQRHATCVLFYLLIYVQLISGVEARTELLLIGNDIPSRLKTGSAHIFSNSDTLLLNDRLLKRGIEYSFEIGQGYFDLTRLSPSETDTLRVIFDPLPPWVARSYKRSLPKVTPVATPGRVAVPSRPGRSTPGTKASKVELSGAKSFRFMARSEGNSEFSQSLDLSLSGELTEGVRVTGSISDRGYDPAYGTVNSRLSELDKVNLSLESRRLTAQLGDISIADTRRRAHGKAVSGASFNLRYPRWHIDGVAARPRGIYKDFAFTGQDGFQGPYQVGEGNRTLPVVPGSESVWLDGQDLERGANKDYLIDYPTGRITFNVNHPIDSRSRIEVAYEPQTTAYRKELFAGGGGAHLPDSALFFSVAVLREGDDRDQSLLGELSDTDRDLLREAGDSSATRSGIVPDTAGAYLIVADSLPDTVFQYVGEGNGYFRVTFSFVGALHGDYQNLGSGQYRYVGKGNGDYLPLVVLRPAERTSHYRATVGLQNRLLDVLRLDVRASSFDRNLWSTIDDENNDGYFYDLSAGKKWLWDGRPGALAVKRRFREAEYQARERINNADFRRDFLLPDRFVPETTELLHDVRTKLDPSEFLSLDASYSDLDYQSAFASRSGRLRVTLVPTQKLRFVSGWKGVSADYTPGSLSGDGRANTYDAAVHLYPTNLSEFSTEYQRDVRENEYFDELRGTRYQRVRVGLSRGPESVRYEYYFEDSLSSHWSEILARNRLAAASARRLGYMSYDATLTYQWLEQPAMSTDAFLGRLNLRYNDARRRLSMAAAYMVSEEQRNARGITYLEVEPGQGNFVRENGQFVPDPAGDFIQVEEILSEAARVRRGEKSFNLSKDWRSVLARFSSTIAEELLQEGNSNLLWVLPFLSDESQPYLFYNRRYNGDLRLIPVRGFYAVNLRLGQEFELRDVAGSPRRRRNTRGEVALKQAIIRTLLEQELAVFNVDRDDYFGGSGNVEGYKIKLGARQSITPGELHGAFSFRRAQGALKEVSKQYAAQIGSRLALFGPGELRTSAEFYTQDFENLSAAPSFQLTDSRTGKRGVRWSVSINHGVESGMRINVTVNGRHADDRVARITARGEMVANF